MQRRIDQLAAAGLVIGAVFGIGGTAVESAALRSVLWTVDGAALVMAASLLALRFVRTGSELAAAGFLVFAIGQGIVLSTAGITPATGAPVFAAGVATWATGLLLISAGRDFPAWIRIAGLAAAALFAVTSLMIQSGSEITALTSPLPSLTYPVLVLTFAGWGWSILWRPQATTER